MIILIFRTKFAQKPYFRCKEEKVNITIELNKLELTLVPNVPSGAKWYQNLNR